MRKDQRALPPVFLSNKDLFASGKATDNAILVSSPITGNTGSSLYNIFPSGTGRIFTYHLKTGRQLAREASIQGSPYLHLSPVVGNVSAVDMSCSRRINSFQNGPCIVGLCNVRSREKTWYGISPIISGKAILDRKY
jgi:hypothetical protein